MIDFVFTELYDLVITPLVYVIELIFAFAYGILDNAGLAIVVVSLCVSTLLLPLMELADKAKDEESLRQEKMKRWVDHINEHFKGDERYMMLSTYYRQQDYHPLMALQGSISLLLQIPFFIAAYNYLSGLQLLDGASLGFLHDLAAPDRLLSLGDIRINVLPIVMTLLNLISAAIYTRGSSLRDRLQPFGLALVFLVLLYDRPSGLVLYWTCNQLFSLIKNIIKAANFNKRTFLLIASQLALVLLTYVLIRGQVLVYFADRVLFFGQRIVMYVVLVTLVELALFKPELIKRFLEKLSMHLSAEPSFVVFILSALVSALVIGLLAPAALIADSPQDFTSALLLNAEQTSPLRALIHTTTVALGFCCVWGGVIYALSDKRAKSIQTQLWPMITLMCLIDYFFFGRNYGTITTDLIFDIDPVSSTLEKLVNLAVLALMCVALIFLWKKRPSAFKPLLSIALISVVVLSVNHIRGIFSGRGEGANTFNLAEESELEDDEQELIQEDAPIFEAPLAEDGSPLPTIRLSRDAQNVVVIFLDRAIGAYVPYIFAEKPELERQFDGFVYYPNTISYGAYTLFGAPALYGGYEYSPVRMNEREDKDIVDKCRESLLVMPTIFSEAGFDTALFDPPFFEVSGYSWLQKGLPSMRLISTEARYNDYLMDKLSLTPASSFPRNLFFYGLMKAAPSLLQHRIYGEGTYNAPNTNEISGRFMNWYSELAILDELTSVDSEQTPSFILLQNSSTHEPQELQLPNYTPEDTIDNSAYESHLRVDPESGEELNLTDPWRLKHYHINMATLLCLGDWFDYLRAEGVWDNTRIIVVADHGRKLGQFDEWLIDDFDIEGVNPLFMYKDFGATGFEVSDEFMTNADTVTLALAGIVEKPINPFTGNAIDDSDKYAGEQMVTSSDRYHIEEHSGASYDFSDGHWYAVSGDMRDPANWRCVD